MITTLLSAGLAVAPLAHAEEVGPGLYGVWEVVHIERPTESFDVHEREAQRQTATADECVTVRQQWDLGPVPAEPPPEDAPPPRPAEQLTIATQVECTGTGVGHYGSESHASVQAVWKGSPEAMVVTIPRVETMAGFLKLKGPDRAKGGMRVPATWNVRTSELELTGGTYKVQLQLPENRWSREPPVLKLVSEAETLTLRPAAGTPYGARDEK